MGRGRLDSSSAQGLLGDLQRCLGHGAAVKPDEVLNESTVRVTLVGSCVGDGLMF